MISLNNGARKVAVLLSLIFIVAAYNNCAETSSKFIIKGTETGNPMTSSTLNLVNAICGVINRCEPQATFTDCQAHVLSAGGIDYQFGLPAGSYASVSDLAAAEKSGSLYGDELATNSCYTEINGLDCSNPGVQRAYDSTQPNPYASVAGIIPTANTAACPSVFKKPEVKAFPTAEGFGAKSVGGRGGRVIHVTNLNDAGAGSFRDALNATGPRIVVFDVSGTINLQSEIDLYGEDHAYLTIAGQTSPGGVQIKGAHGIWFREGTHDVIIRYLRVRPGGPANGTNGDVGLGVYANTTTLWNFIFDHCSIAWANAGEVAVFMTNGFTIQWSLIAEPRVPTGAGDQTLSSAMGLVDTSASVHHNLFVNVADNSPSLKGGDTDFRNNVVYNYLNNNGMRWGYFTENGSSFGNSVNNHYIAGPDSNTTEYLAVSNAGPTRIDGTSADRGGTKIYSEGTWGPLCPSGCADDWSNSITTLDYWYQSGGALQPALQSVFRAWIPFAAPPVNTDSTGSLKAKLLPLVGANKPARDSADTKFINDVINGTGSIYAIGMGGPWPALTGGAPAPDTDADGMPDAWETSHGLNSNDATDGAKAATNGYTNVENYLNELAGDSI